MQKAGGNFSASHLYKKTHPDVAQVQRSTGLLLEALHGVQLHGVQLLPAYTGGNEDPNYFPTKQESVVWGTK